MNKYEQTLGMSCVWCQPAPSEEHKKLVAYEADILACSRTATLMRGLGLDESLIAPVEMVRNYAVLGSTSERIRLGLPRREDD